MDNLFTNSPTVGSEDGNMDIARLMEIIVKLQNDFTNVKNQQLSVGNPQRISAEGIKEVFVEVIIPLINAAGGLGNLGQLINALARYKAVSVQNNAYMHQPPFPPQPPFPSHPYFTPYNGYFDPFYGCDYFNSPYGNNSYFNHERRFN